MICLSSRQMEILKFLLKYREYQPVKKIADNMECSVKTIRNDLNVIEDYMSNNNIKIIKKPGIGIKLYSLEDEDIQLSLIPEIRRMEKLDKQSTRYRRMKILFNLLNDSNKITSIRKLSEEYYVSKTSIVNDLKQIDDYLKQYNIKLDKGKEGTKVVGDEVNIRKAIAGLFDNLTSHSCELSKFDVYNKIDKVTLDELFIQFGEKMLNLFKIL